LRGKTILIVGVNYWPESAGIGPYTSGMARHLAEAGASVQVLTAVPHYPAWQVQDDYAGVRHMVEKHDGVTVTRVRPFIPQRMSTPGRARFELSFGRRVYAAARTIRADAIIAIVPSLLGALAASRLAHKRSVPFGVVFQDLMGRAAEQSGMAGTVVSSATAALERRLARQANRCGVVTAGFAPFFLDSGVPAPRIAHLANWCQIAPPTRSRAETRREIGWKDSDVIALHAGNMGAKQELENVIAAARAASSSTVKFVLMGHGSRRLALQAMSAGVGNVQFIDPQPSHTFPNILAAADVLLVNERASVRDMSLPSKLTSYFAAGRPVIAATRSDGTTAAEIEKSGGGVVIQPGNPAALFAQVVRVTSNAGWAQQLGCRGRQYAAEHLSEAAAALRNANFARNLLGASVPTGTP
jgi:glycosyltransferase involved in cell wall biosynthesis